LLPAPGSIIQATAPLGFALKTQITVPTYISATLGADSVAIKNPARWPGLVHDMNSMRLFRAAVVATRLGILIRARVAGWRIPVLWSFVGTLLWLRVSLLKSGIMTLARVRGLLAWSRIWRFRAVVVVDHHSLPSVAQGLRLISERSSEHEECCLLDERTFSLTQTLEGASRSRDRSSPANLTHMKKANAVNIGLSH